MNRTDTPGDPVAPYRGIDPYRYADRANFFGRKHTVDRLFAKILVSRLVVLFGESGSGKSSVINAGLLPALITEGMQPERLRVLPIRQDPISIERIAIGTADDSTVLPSLFASVADPGASGTLSCSLENFTAVIEERAADARPVLIFDQFEELFTLFGQGAYASPEEEVALQEQLLQTILQLVNSRLRVKVLVIIREDFLGKLEAMATDYPRVLDHRVRLRRLGRDEAREAILGPFTNVPLPFPAHLQPALADRIVDDLSRGQRDVQIQPTQLQIVCKRLWDHHAPAVTSIGLAQYEALGGVEQILESFWQAELDRADPDLRFLAVLVLSNLITKAGTRDVVSEDKLKAFMEDDLQAGYDAALLAGTFQFLDQRRFVNQRPQRGTYYYEVSSEYLIPLILRESEAVAVQQELAAAALAAQQQLDAARAEAERKAQAVRETARQRALRRNRWIAVAAVLALLMTLTALARTIQARRAADRERHKAVAAEAATREARDSVQVLLNVQSMLNDSLQLMVLELNELRKDLVVNLDTSEARRIRAEIQSDLAEERRQTAEALTIELAASNDQLGQANSNLNSALAEARLLKQEADSLYSLERAWRQADSLMNTVTTRLAAGTFGGETGGATGAATGAALLADARRADSLYRYADRPAGIALALVTLGDILLRQGRYAQARDSLLASRTVQRSRGYGDEADILEKLGDVHQAWADTLIGQGAFEAGIDQYEQALQRYRSAVQRAPQTEELARLHMKQGDIFSKKGQSHPRPAAASSAAQIEARAHRQADYQAAINAYEAAWPLWGSLKHDPGQLAVLNNLDAAYRAAGRRHLSKQAAIASIDYYSPVEVPAVTVEAPLGINVGGGKATGLFWPRFNFDIGFNAFNRYFRFGTSFAITGPSFDDISQAEFAGLRLSYRLRAVHQGPVVSRVWRLALESLQSFGREQRMIGPALIHERGLLHYTLRVGVMQDIDASFLSRGEETFFQFSVGLNLFDGYRLCSARRRFKGLGFLCRAPLPPHLQDGRTGRGQRGR